MRISAEYDYDRDVIKVKVKTVDSEGCLEIDESGATLDLSDSEKEYRELQAHVSFIVKVFNKVSDTLSAALNDQMLHERLAVIFRSEVSDEHSIDSAVERALKTRPVTEIIKNYITKAL